MKSLNIKSVTQSEKIVYVIDHEYEYCPNFRLGDKVRQFDTYGDGETQHSHSYFSPASNAYDFLLSLLAVLGDDSKCDQETLELIRWEIGYGIEAMSKEIAEFLQTVIYNPEKRARYFSLEEKKISSNENKRHDKRWFQIPDWATGKADSIVGLWNLAHNGGRDNMLALMGLWARACEVCNCSYAFSECKTIEECFGDKCHEALSLFTLVRDLINTRSQLAWQTSRAQSIVADASKPKAEQAAA